MIENIDELIKGQRNRGFFRRRKKINTITNSPSANSIEEAKAKVEEIIAAGRKRRKKRKDKDA